MTFDKEEAQQDLKSRRDLPPVGGVYRHYKGGLYVVLAVGLDEGNREPMVAYRSNARNTVWFRTLSNFQSEVSPGVRRFVREES